MPRMQDSLYRSRGFVMIAGTDEAGRGPWAGPVYAAAVILPERVRLPGLDDSKKINEATREKLFPLIQEQAISWCIASASVEEIDALNIRDASFLAMKRSLEGLGHIPDLVLSDGFKIPNYHLPNEGVVKGDGKLRCIAAASILAKVARDRYMHQQHELYPAYNFAKHKGYGTPEHQEALRKHGICEIHRKSFAPIKLLNVQ